LVKNLDLDDELDDFDGGDDYAEDGAGEGSSALLPGLKYLSRMCNSYKELYILIPESCRAQRRRPRSVYPSKTPYPQAQDSKSELKRFVLEYMRAGTVAVRGTVALLLRYPENGRLSDKDVRDGAAEEGEES
jgi:hypothetical protein